MRDPNRIKLLLEKIERIWSYYPDLRFGQLCIAIFDTANSDIIFTMEDDEFDKKLNQFLKRTC